MLALAVALAAAFLLVMSWQEHRRRAEDRADLEAIMAETGLAASDPDAAGRVLREKDPDWARLRLAHALMAGVPDPASVDVEEPADVSQRLEVARSLARDVMAARPGQWRAPWLYGAATYLGWSVTGDPKLLTERAQWEGPLQRAVAMAAGRRQPREFLAGAYLEVWPVLSADERTDARLFLAETLRDQTSLKTLVGPLLERFSDLDEAFQMLPDESAAWRAVEQHFRATHDWEAVARARDLRRRALERELPLRLAEITRLLDRGDTVAARRTTNEVIASAQPDRCYSDTVAAIIGRCPPGPVREWTARAYGDWLQWALQGFVRGQHPLQPEVFDRFRKAALSLDPDDQAVALLASGRPAEAGALAGRREDLNTEAWAWYCLADARRLAELGELAAARARLKLMHRNLGGMPEAQRVSRLVDTPGGLPEQWWSGVPDLAGVSWAATEWRWQQRMAYLDLVVDHDVAGLTVEVDSAPADGAVVEMQLDLLTVWTGAVMPGETLTITHSVPAGPHLLRFLTVLGGRVRPGEVALAESDPDA